MDYFALTVATVRKQAAMLFDSDMDQQDWLNDRWERRTQLTCDRCGVFLEYDRDRPSNLCSACIRELLAAREAQTDGAA